MQGDSDKVIDTECARSCDNTDNTVYMKIVRVKSRCTMKTVVFEMVIQKISEDHFACLN